MAQQQQQAHNFHQFCHFHQRNNSIQHQHALQQQNFPRQSTQMQIPVTSAQGAASVVQEQRGIQQAAAIYPQELLQLL